MDILQRTALSPGSGGQAHCFAALAPESMASYLEHVWLGKPHNSQAVPETESDAGDSVCIPLTQLGAYRTELLDAMVSHYGGDGEIHARALLSQWSKYYFWLAAPAGIAALLLRRPLDMSPARTQLVLRAGMPTALYFAADALQPPENDCTRCYAPLVEHLQAVIETLADMARIAPRVLWGNVGNLLDYLAGQCAALPGVANDIACLFRPVAADGSPNPLRTPVRQVKPGSALLPDPFRARRVCCMRNQIPGETNLCASCPLLLTMHDEALALQDAIR
ncbi:siderophore-iron reductase FhuF [Collimonas fungivorans]|uniref:Ferric reductase n=1 Tax=Collimonas fungivorans (strain Ter331) TaxID=1005048 RepID=G0A920_COLFT|nr:siderophore-iron reductase FhuF [Collimonas fungivorans]AEK62126.1 Ferric reductase [Collimonas fungivorans Ter331]